MLRFIAVLLTLAFISPAAGQSVGLSGDKGRGSWVHNLSAPQNGTYAFINLFKLCYNLGQQAAFPIGNYLNSQGYPSTTPPAEIGCTIVTPQQYTGNYVVKWTGTLSGNSSPGAWITGGGAYTVVSASPSEAACVTDKSNGIKLKGADCTVEFTTATKVASLQFTFLTTGTLSNVTNIAVYQKTWESQYNAGEIFNPDYLAMLRELNPRIFRMLGYSNPYNQDTRSRYSSLTPANAATYAAEYYDQTAWVSATASYNGGTDTYSVNAPSGWAGLVNGAVVQFYTTDDNTTTAPKLSVGGTTAKTIKTYNYISAMSAGQIGPSGARINTAVYDSVLDIWLLKSYGFHTQVSLADQVAICNKLAKDCWFVLPYLFDDASFATYGAFVRDNLDPSLNAYFEFSNEIGTGFPSTHWAGAHSIARALPDIGITSGPVGDYTMQGWGQRRIMEQVCGSSKSTCATWTANGRKLSTLKGLAMAEVFQSYINLPRLRFNGDFQMFDSNGMFTTGPTGAEVVGTTATNILTVTAVNSGVVRAGMPISGTGIAGGTYIMTRITGTGGTGTYTLSTSPGTLGSRTFTLTAGGTGNAIVTNYSESPNRVRDFADYSSYANYFGGPNVHGGTSLAYPLSSSNKTITTISNATTGVVTSASHGYSNGDRVQLWTVSGMTELSGAWTTVSAATTDTFELSNTYSADGSTAISSNTTSYGTFTSGQMSRLVPGLNTAVLAAADDYASGDPVRMRSALAYVSNDVRQGTRLNAAGVATLGDQTIENIISNTGPQCCISWAQWGSEVVTPMGLPLIGYEGGFEYYFTTNAAMNQLGISVDYAGKINAMMTAWRLSDHFRKTTNELLESYRTTSTNLWPGNLQDADNGLYTAGATVSSSGTTLTIADISGSAYPGCTILSGSFASGTVILKQLTGTNASNGTYQLNVANTVGAESAAIYCPSIWSIMTGDTYSTRYGEFNALSNFGAAP